MNCPCCNQSWTPPRLAVSDGVVCVTTTPGYGYKLDVVQP
jgi:hypothetical protein